MYKVFLSSTSKDLAEYREAVLDVIAKLDDFEAVAMENFGARDASAIEFDAEKIGQSDLLVGLLGLCYGSSPRGQPPSFTELEYAAAVQGGKPCLMFVAPDDFPVRGLHRETDEQWQRQQAFRNRIKAERIVSDAFDTPEKLASAVTASLTNWLSKRRNMVAVEAKPAVEPREVVPPAEPPLGPNPYRGLEAFRKEDAERFYGREALVDQLWETFLELHAALTKGKTPTRLLAIVGASGSGKSSVAQAGLLAQLEQRPLPGRPSPIDVMLTPEARPLESLAVALARQVTGEGAPAKMAIEFEDVLRMRAGHDGLRYLAERALDVGGAGLILLVDQFEELYSLCDDEAQRIAFTGNLLNAAREPRGNVSIVLTLRSDFLGAVNHHPELARLIARQNVVVAAMDEAELRRAIEEPARRAGREVDPGTVQLLLEQTRGREGALPLLEFVLTRIWDGFSRGVAAAETVHELGGVGGALARQAQAVYDSLGPDEQRIARRAFLAMVRLGEGTADTRRRARLSDIVVNGQPYEDVLRVLRRFAERDCRLVTLGSNGTERTAEVTHEALLEQWSQVRAWLDGGRDDLRLWQRLNDAAREWREKGEPDGLLWRPPLLDLLQEYRDRCIADMTGLQQEFLSRSLDAEKLRAQEKQQLTSRALAAQSRYLASTAREILAKGDSELALILVLESLPRNLQEPERPVVEAGIRELLRVIGAFPLAVLEGHEQVFRRTHSGSYLAGKVRASFSPDSRCLVTASDDGTSRVWDAQTGATIAVLEGHEDSVRTAIFSPDGTKVVTASDDGTARLWHATSGRELAVLRGHEEALWSAAFSPDGTMVVTASDDETARLWDATSGQPVAVLQGHDDKVLSASFNPDGTKVLTTSSDATARLWDAVSGEKLSVLRGHDDAVLSASFSPNGHRVATWSHDGTVRIWDATSSQSLIILKDDMRDVIAAAWSPDGRHVATASVDGTARVWDSESGRFETLLELEEEYPHWLALSPSGRYLVIPCHFYCEPETGWGGGVPMWDLRASRELTALWHDQAGFAVFSPDGRRLVTTSDDGTAKIWPVFSTDQEVFEYARSTVPRRLTPEERERFFLD